MRLTSKRELEIRLGLGDDYLDQIKDLIGEIDYLRAELIESVDLIIEMTDELDPRTAKLRN